MAFGFASCLLIGCSASDGKELEFDHTPARLYALVEDRDDEFLQSFSVNMEIEGLADVLQPQAGKVTWNATLDEVKDTWVLVKGTPTYSAPSYESDQAYEFWRDSERSLYWDGQRYLRYTASDVVRFGKDNQVTGREKGAPNLEVLDASKPHRLDRAVFLYAWALGRGLTLVVDSFDSLESLDSGQWRATGPGRFGDSSGIWTLTVDESAGLLVRSAVFETPSKSSPSFVMQNSGSIRSGDDCIAARAAVLSFPASEFPPGSTDLEQRITVQMAVRDADRSRIAAVLARSDPSRTDVTVIDDLGGGVRKPTDR